MSAVVRAIVLQSLLIFSISVVEWFSGDRNQEIVWNTMSYADVIYHRVTLQTQIIFGEDLLKAAWGTLYYAMQAVSDTNLSAL